MEAQLPQDPSQRLSLFLQSVATFLRGIADSESVGTREERESLAQAVDELRTTQLERATEDLAGADQEALSASGFSRFQLEFKLLVAERAMNEALEKEESSRPLLPSRIWRAVRKVRVVLASIKGLSKWLEALDELVGLAGELAANRLEPRLD